MCPTSPGDDSPAAADISIPEVFWKRNFKQLFCSDAFFLTYICLPTCMQKCQLSQIYQNSIVVFSLKHYTLVGFEWPISRFGRICDTTVPP
jgi:hypothetical protein